ncbi:MAG TPA: primosomal protein N' [Phycisphaerae bacterium]|nr:primosomal protein N' [Phycisphaerae bacterium]
MRVGPVARVAIIAGIEGQYTYTIPDHLADQVVPGKRLVVPLGRRGRPVVAFCVAVGREPWTSALRPVREVLDEERLLSDSLLELGEWMARYYCCRTGRTLAAMVPEAIRSQAGFRAVHVYRSAVAVSAESPARKSEKRQKVLEVLSGNPDGLPLEEMLARCGVTRGLLNGMVKAGRIQVTTRREPAPAPDFDRPGEEPVFELNEAQRAAIERIDHLTDRNAFRVILLYGVSGSGKTEVYVRSIRSVLQRGRQAIMLVPEIALTTQIVDRLTSRFRDVAVIHSGLTGVQRSLTWAAIARGEKRVVIGTRSAIFAPCPNLGLIVVDEEQEGSYKNLQAPRFHTRDVAIKRAQLAAVPIVLGSATPSLETWHNCARLPHFERIMLPGRISGLPMPEVEFVDMRLARQERPGLHLLSARCEELLRRTLEQGQQAVLLLNRRGYANYLMCRRCRQPILCPNCRVNMVFHQTTGQAMCHYCQARMIVPTRCSDPSCNGLLVRWGMGTQRVEEELRNKFPQSRIARADSDTMIHRSHYEEMVRGFAAHDIDILVGTQMIAKGLDFPEVAFVGAINADTALAIPDFRSSERTFQLITQVAGRAGRAEAGARVVVQSLTGMTPALQHAMGHDYAGFAGYELAVRERVGWPPFSRLARVVVSNRSHDEAQREARELSDEIRRHITEHKLAADVLGPQSAPLARLRTLYRFDFLIRSANAGRLMDALEHLRHNGILGKVGRNVLIDVDPVSLL